MRLSASSTWRPILIELSVVALGVLIALAVDNWNDSRSDHAIERDYLRRLIEDLQFDTAQSTEFDQLASRKEQALEAVAPILRGAGEVGVDTAAFLTDLIWSTSLGWAHTPARRTTFEDLRSTGNLRLIRDTDLRAAIVDHYNRVEAATTRIDRRRGLFPTQVYALVPRSSDSEGDEFRLREDMRGASYASIMRSVRNSELGEQVIGELNFVRFFRLQQRQLRQEALDLLGRLNAHQR